MKEERKQWLKKYLLIILPAVITVAVDLFSYMVPKQLVPVERYAFLDMEIDRKIPFIPWFILFYFLAFVQWANYFLQASFGDRKLRNEYFGSDVAAKIVIFFIFMYIWPLAVPRPEVNAAEGFWHWVVSLTFTVDNPLGAFPSIHCYYSWLAFRYSYEVEPKGRRWICWAQLLFSLAVFASTVLVKQHYFVDILGGIAFAEIFLWVARHTAIPAIFGKAMEKLIGEKPQDTE